MIRIIAFFDLKKSKDPEEFLDWVKTRQTPVFKKMIPEIRDFRVFRTIDEDGDAGLPKMVQVFDYEGTPDDWRQTLDEMRETGDSKMSKIVEEWLGYCIDKSTRIIYLDDLN